MTAVELQGAYNVRDLGGLRTRDGRRTKHGVIYRGDSLDGITPADARTLFDKLSIGAIVDLRTKAETELGGQSLPVPRYRYSVLPEGRLGLEPFPSDDPVRRTCGPGSRRCSTAPPGATGPASWPRSCSDSSA